MYTSLLTKKKRSAMSTDYDKDGSLKVLSNNDLEYLKDNNYYFVDQEEVNDPWLELTETTLETAEEILKGIQNLGAIGYDDWVEEQPLLDYQSPLELFGDLNYQTTENNICDDSILQNGDFWEELKDLPIETSKADITPEKKVVALSDAESFENKSSGDESQGEKISECNSGGNSGCSTVDWTKLLDEQFSSSGESDHLESDSSTSYASSPVQDSSPGWTPGEEESDDPEWEPQKMKTKTGKKYYGRKSKPYETGSAEEKKLRKKEQNKQAAIRYRRKKKLESSEKIKEEEQLIEKNLELKIKKEEVEREIKCIKDLLRSFWKAKGLIN